MGTKVDDILPTNSFPICSSQIDAVIEGYRIKPSVVVATVLVKYKIRATAMITIEQEQTSSGLLVDQVLQLLVNI